MTIACDDKNMKCFRCHKNQDCDVLRSVSSLLLANEDNKDVTIRFEIPKCGNFDDGLSGSLDDFLIKI